MSPAPVTRHSKKRKALPDVDGVRVKTVNQPHQTRKAKQVLVTTQAGHNERERGRDGKCDNTNWIRNRNVDCIRSNTYFSVHTTV